MPLPGSWSKSSCHPGDRAGLGLTSENKVRSGLSESGDLPAVLRFLSKYPSGDPLPAAYLPRARVSGRPHLAPRTAESVGWGISANCLCSQSLGYRNGQ